MLRNEEVCQPSFLPISLTHPSLSLLFQSLIVLHRVFGTDRRRCAHSVRSFPAVYSPSLVSTVSFASSVPTRWGKMPGAPTVMRR